MTRSRCYTRGIIHGDIAAGRDARRFQLVVLMDFGTAQHFRNAAPALVTVGTLAFLAPEVLQGAVSSPRSDVYALGVLLFRLLTGTYPYTAQDFKSLGEQQRAQPPRKLSSLAPHVPPAIARARSHACSRSAAPASWHVCVCSSPRNSFAENRQDQGTCGRVDVGAAALIAGGVAWVMGSSRVAEPDTKISLVRETANEGRETLQSGSLVTLGDQLAVEFQSTYPAYVYIFGSSEDNKATVLFPISGAFPVNPLAPGTMHHIPGSVGGRLVDWEVVTEAPSEEVVTPVATQPQPDLDREIARLDHANADASYAASLPRSMSRLVLHRRS